MRFAHVSYNGTLKPDITSITKAVNTCAVDGTDTLDITTLDGGVEKNDRLLYLDGKGLWHEYIVQSVETQRDEGKPVTTAYCVNSIAELGSVYILDKRGRKTTAPERAKVALEGTRWNVGTVDNGTIRHYTDLNFYHQSVLKSLQDITKAYGLELETSISVENGKVTARTVNLLEQRGNKNAERRFEYGCDLKSVKRTLMAEQVITRLYAWGKGEEKTDDDGNTTGGYSRRIGLKEVNGGKAYLDNVEAQKYWGVLEGDAVFDDCDDRNELLRLAKARLTQVSKPQVAYEADVVNLGRAGFDAHGVSVGDSVQIVDTTFNPPIRVEGRVLKIEEDLLDSVDATRITLGNISESYTQRRFAMQQKLDVLIAQSDEWNAVAEGNGLYVRDLIGRMNEILNARGGYTYFTPNAGLYVYNKNKDKNPTTVTQISGGFWRIADSKKSNGDWDWKNVCDGHGLFANRIYTGILSDAQGRNFWNLDTGEFSLQAAAKIGGKTVQQIVNDSADGVISKMNESLTQEAIFNKLTNGGETQGIYLSGGHVYLNASYMRTGYLSADMIKTGNLDANLIRAGRIQDYANSNWWDLTNSSIHVSRGEIGGMTINNGMIYNDHMALMTDGIHFSTSAGNSFGHIGYRAGYSGEATMAFEADDWHTSLSWWCGGQMRMLLNNDGIGASPTPGFTIFGNLSLSNRSLTNAVIDKTCRVSGGGVFMPVREYYLPFEINQQTGVVLQWQPVRFGFSHGFVTTEDWGY